MTDLTPPRPIVDPMGFYIFIPVSAAADETAAVHAARQHEPGRECYEPIGVENWQIRPVDPASEDDEFLIAEYGAQTVAEPAEHDGDGAPFWAVALHADAIPGDLNLELHVADDTPVCVGQWCCGCKVHPIGKPWGWNDQAWARHMACQHPERHG